MSKKNNKDKVWTVTLTAGPQSPIKQFKLSKLVFYGSVFATALLLIAMVGLIFVVSLLNQEKQDLYTRIEEQGIELEEARKGYIIMEKEALAVQRSIEEFKLLEEQLNKLNLDIPKTGDGSGGIEYPPDYQQSYDTPRKLIELREELPSLITDFEETYNRLQEYEEELRTIPTLFPAAEGRISSNYGVRNDPITRGSAFHSGADIAAPVNTPIFAAADGKVTFAGRKGGYGLVVILVHNGTYETTYAHLNTIDVSEGDLVKKGDTIGGMGTTGRSTGVHLHYEIKRNGEYVDPYPYITFHQK